MASVADILGMGRMGKYTGYTHLQGKPGINLETGVYNPYIAGSWCPFGCFTADPCFHVGNHLWSRDDWAAYHRQQREAAEAEYSRRQARGYGQALAEDGYQGGGIRLDNMHDQNKPDILAVGEFILNA